MRDLDHGLKGILLNGIERSSPESVCEDIALIDDFSRRGQFAAPGPSCCDEPGIVRRVFTGELIRRTGERLTVQKLSRIDYWLDDEDASC